MYAIDGLLAILEILPPLPLPKHGVCRAGLMAKNGSAQCHVDAHRKPPATWLPLCLRTGLWEKRGHLIGLLSMLCQLSNCLSILKKLIYPACSLLGSFWPLSGSLEDASEFHLFHLPPEPLNPLWLPITVSTRMRHCSQCRKLLAMDGSWWGDSEEITEIARQWWLSFIKSETNNIHVWVNLRLRLV